MIPKQTEGIPGREPQAPEIRELKQCEVTNATKNQVSGIHSCMTRQTPRHAPPWNVEPMSVNRGIAMSALTRIFPLVRMMMRQSTIPTTARKITRVVVIELPFMISSIRPQAG